MKLPTREQCLQWYEDIGTHPDIMKHVLMVNKVAVFLAKKLKENNIKINVELIDRASLLHDLDKWLCINDDKVKHGYETEKILIKKGYPELGYYAKQHVLDFSLQGFDTWEEKVICYADTRVLRDKIVSLNERLEYIFERYANKYSNKEKKLRKALKKIEDEIFSKLDFEPDKLGKLIGQNI